MIIAIVRGPPVVSTSAAEYPVPSAVSLIVVPYMSCRSIKSILSESVAARPRPSTGLKEKSSLVREALKALIERESALRLARLGGSGSDLKARPRRQAAKA